MDRLAEILVLLTDDARAELSDEAVGALHDELVTLFNAIKNGESEDIPSHKIDVMTDVINGVKVLRAEADTRLAAFEARQAEIDALAAEITVEEAEPVVEAEPLTAETEELVEAETLAEEPAEPEPEAEPQKVAASAEIRKVMARTRPAHSAPLRRAVNDFMRSTPGGQAIDMDQAVSAMLERWESMGSTPAGFSEKVSVAKIKTAAYPNDRVLSEDPSRALAQIRDQIDDASNPNRWQDEAVTAAGGWCAPVQPLYDFLNLSEAQRPARDALPSFQVRRGGITYAPPAALSAIQTSTSAASGSAVARLTEAQDIAGTPTKPVQTITCPTAQTVKLDIITKILKFGNLEDRAWPELVRHWTELTMAAWARMADSLLLTRIGAGSTSVTGGATTYGAAPTLLSQMNRAASAYRNRHRMRPDARLRVLVPAWLIGMLQDDIAMRGYEGSELFGASEADVRSWFAARNINASFHWDGETTGGATGQIFGSQPASVAVLSWPDVLIWYMFSEGSWVFLDGGELDLGVVRDSTLNSTNDYETFSESFENAAFFGVESLKVTSTICASGAAGGVVTPVCSGS